MYIADILHLTPESALQECTCIQQKQATAYSGIYIAKLHMHTADMLWLTPESVLQEYTCIQQRHMLRAYTGTYVARMHVYTIEKG